VNKRGKFSFKDCFNKYLEEGKNEGIILEPAGLLAY